MGTTSPPPAPAAFDYAALDVSDRAWLRDRTAAVRLTSRRVAAELTALGVTLLAVKERIGHGHFRKWCEAELTWSHMQTLRLMRVGEIFGGVIEKQHRVTFDPTALYLLAQPSTPQGAREYALELAAAGQKVSAGIAREIVNGWRRVPVLTKSETRALAPDRPEDRKPVAAPAAAPGPWDAVRAALADASTLHVSRVFAGDEDGHTFAVTLISDTGRARTELGADLAGVMMRLAGLEKKRTCPRCQVAKPVPQFARNADLPDGVNRYCKQCERGRLAAHKRKKKAAGGGSPAA